MKTIEINQFDEMGAKKTYFETQPLIRRQDTMWINIGRWGGRGGWYPCSHNKGLGGSHARIMQ